MQSYVFLQITSQPHESCRYKYQSYNIKCNYKYTSLTFTKRLILTCIKHKTYPISATYLASDIGSNVVRFRPPL